MTETGGDRRDILRADIVVCALIGVNRASPRLVRSVDHRAQDPAGRLGRPSCVDAGVRSIGARRLVLSGGLGGALILTGVSSPAPWARATLEGGSRSRRPTELVLRCWCLSDPWGRRGTASGLAATRRAAQRIGLKRAVGVERMASVEEGSAIGNARCTVPSGRRPKESTQCPQRMSVLYHVPSRSHPGVVVEVRRWFSGQRGEGSGAMSPDNQLHLRGRGVPR